MQQQRRHCVDNVSLWKLGLELLDCSAHTPTLAHPKFRDEYCADKPMRVAQGQWELITKLPVSQFIWSVRPVESAPTAKSGIIGTTAVK
jgi:hypothetical protein